WKNIEQPPYGKGYVIADQQWQRFIKGITALRDKHNMTIVMVAHSEIIRTDDPRVRQRQALIGELERSLTPPPPEPEPTVGYVEPEEERGICGIKPVRWR